MALNLQALDPHQHSSLLSLFDLFLKYHSNPCPLLYLNPFESQYLQKSTQRLHSILISIGMKLGVDEKASFWVSKSAQCGEVMLGLEEIQIYVVQVEERLYKPFVFDYNSWVEKNLQAGVQVIRKLCPLFEGSDFETISQIKAHAIVPAPEGSGIEMYEISFQAAGVNMIIFPDANLFSKVHESIWLETASKPHRLYRDYFFACSYAPLHELIHCFQHVSIGPTSNSNIWRKEFEASIAQMNFMNAVAHFFPEVYHPGLVEEVLMWYFEIIHRIHGLIDESIKVTGYKQWRDSASKLDPVVHDATSFLAEYRKECYYLKARAAMEFFNDDISEFQQFLNLHFDSKSSKDDMWASHVRYMQEKDIDHLLSPPIKQSLG